MTLRDPSLDQVLTVIALAGAANDAVSIETAEQQLHDRLIAENPIRLGPVHWLRFAADEADKVIALVAHNPEQYAGLKAWLVAREGAVLILAMVDIPSLAATQGRPA
jgi:hypothetical protein